MSSISIVIPNYNHGRYLREVFHSIQTQSRQPLEVIVVDDASTDNSIEILRAIQQEYPKLRIIQNEQNQGPFLSLIKGAKVAQGTFVTQTPADDLLAPGTIEAWHQIIDVRPDVGLVTGPAYEFEDVQPYQFRPTHFSPFSSPQVVEKEDVFDFHQKTLFFVLSLATAYRKDLFLKYGFERRFRSTADQYLNSQIALDSSIGIVPQRIAFRRSLPNSFGGQERKSYQIRIEIFRAHLDRIFYEEPPALRKPLSHLTIYMFGGYSLLLTIAVTPRHWSRFLPALYYTLLRKYRVKQLRKQGTHLLF